MFEWERLRREATPISAASAEGSIAAAGSAPAGEGNDDTAAVDEWLAASQGRIMRCCCVSFVLQYV